MSVNIETLRQRRVCATHTISESEAEEYKTSKYKAAALRLSCCQKYVLGDIVVGTSEQTSFYADICANSFYGLRGRDHFKGGWLASLIQIRSRGVQ